MHIDVIENGVGQAVKVIQGANGLGELFVQAVTDLLGACVIGNEYGESIALAQLGPVGLGAAAGGLVLGNIGNIGHNKAGRMRQVFANVGAAYGLNCDVGIRSVCQAHIKAGLALEAIDQTSKIGQERRGRSTCNADADWAFETGEYGELST